MKRIFWFFFLLPVSLYAVPGFITFPSDISWRQQSSPHFEVIFREGDDALAAKVLRLAEHTHKILSPVFPEGPAYTRIVLADFQDSTNGYALNFPYPHIVLFLSPPEPIGQLTSLDDWLSSILLHEYVHILHIYPANGIWKPMRWLFGSWVVPNGLMPTHFHEGMAVLLETEKTQGGRGRSTSFEMQKRMAVEEGKWNLESQPMDRFEASPATWPMGVSPYFYGYYFSKELWDRKGAKGIYQLTDSFSSNWPYLLNGPLNEVYGTDYTTLWQEIYKKTGDKTKTEIETIKKTPLSPLTWLTDSRFYLWDITLSPDAKRLAYRRTIPSEGNRLIVAEAATGKTLKNIEIAAGGTFSLCWGNKEGRDLVLFPKLNRDNHYAVNSISGWDLAKDKSVNFPALKHVHVFGCDKDLKRVVAYQERATVGKIMDFEWVKIDQEIKTKREWPVPSGTYVSSVLVTDSTWFTLKRGLKTQLYKWEGADPKMVLEVPAYLYNLRVGRRPGEFFAIGTFDGRDEIWSIDLAKKEVTKVVGVLGGVASFDRQGEKFWISSYRNGGFDLATATPISGTKKNLSQGRIPEERNIASEEEVKLSPAESYSPLSTLLPRTWVPSLLFVPDGAQFGVWIPGFDLAQKHFYDIFGGYDTRGLPFASLSYNYRFGNGHVSGVESYLFPNYLISTQTFQTQWGASIFYSGNWSFLPPAIRLGFEYRKIERSPLGDANQAVGPQIGLSYKFGFKQKPLEVSPTQGTSLSLTHSQFFKTVGSDDNFFSTIAGVEQYFPAPWWSESAWYLAGRAGYTEGNSIYNSYYTAGGELLFSQGRNYFLNRGFLPQTFFARRIVNFNLEYRFPIGRVDHGYKLWPGFLRNVHGAAVLDVTTKDLGLHHPKDFFTTSIQNLFRIYYVSVGLEVKSEWTMFFYLPTQIRLGVYHGFGKFGESIYGSLGLEAAL